MFFQNSNVRTFNFCDIVSQVDEFVNCVCETFCFNVIKDKMIDFVLKTMLHNNPVLYCAKMRLFTKINCRCCLQTRQLGSSGHAKNVACVADRRGWGCGRVFAFLAPKFTYTAPQTRPQPLKTAGYAGYKKCWSCAKWNLYYVFEFYAKRLFTTLLKSIVKYLDFLEVCHEFWIT